MGNVSARASSATVWLTSGREHGDACLSVHSTPSDRPLASRARSPTERALTSLSFSRRRVRERVPRDTVPEAERSVVRASGRPGQSRVSQSVSHSPARVALPSSGPSID